MEKPFELSVVDALVANALRKAVRVKADDGSPSAYQSEVIAGTLLCGVGKRGLSGNDRATYLIAGFRLALRLCCRILADPLRVHAAGIRRDVKEAEQSLAMWREERRAVSVRTDDFETSASVGDNPLNK